MCKVTVRSKRTTTNTSFGLQRASSGHCDVTTSNLHNSRLRNMQQGGVAWLRQTGKKDAAIVSNMWRIMRLWNNPYSANNQINKQCVKEHNRTISSNTEPQECWRSPRLWVASLLSRPSPERSSDGTRGISTCWRPRRLRTIPSCRTRTSGGARASSSVYRTAGWTHDPVCGTNTADRPRSSPRFFRSSSSSDVCITTWTLSHYNNTTYHCSAILRLSFKSASL